MSYWRGKRALVTGGTAGLGKVLASVLAQNGADVAVVARGQESLDATSKELTAHGGRVLPLAADVTNSDDISRIRTSVLHEWGGIDLVCHCAGRSMRGGFLSTPLAQFHELMTINFFAAVNIAQTFSAELDASNGHLVLIGSLASKAAPGYLGAYATSKFPLSAMAQQLRVESQGNGFHTLLVCPGPIARESETGDRYQAHADDIPAAAHKPGGGAKVSAIDPHWLSGKILEACEQRRPELVVPKRARLLFALSQLSPRLGDWCLRRMTS